MKTTVDIPDELFREAKSRAAREGIKLRELVAEALREKLNMPSVQPQRQRRRAKFPLVASKRTDAPVTVEQVKDALAILEEEEAKHHAGLV